MAIPMWNLKKVEFFLGVIFFATLVNAGAQTGGVIAVISPQISASRQPLLWKNVDGASADASLHFFSGSNYDFIGLVAANDTTAVAGGLNSAGFGIVFSQSVFEQADTTTLNMGAFCKDALGRCGLIRDFSELLAAQEKPLPASAAFACIDLRGNAGLFETENGMNINDAEQAPDGFRIRSSFTFARSDSANGTVWRYHRAAEMIKTFAKHDALNPRTLIRYVARDLHSPDLNPYPLPFEKTHAKAPRGFIPTQFALNQFNTVAGLVIQGGTDTTALPTLWVLLGMPVVSAAIPVWPQAGAVPDICSGEDAFLNRVFQSRRDRLFSRKKVPTFLDSKMLVSERSGFLPQINQFEQSIFQTIEQKRIQWQTRVDLDDMIVTQNEIANECAKRLR